MARLLDKRRLSNGLVVEFYDRSNRYFGDYHRVCIEVCCRAEVTAAYFGAEEDGRAAYERALAQLGGEVVSVRRLERMGVAGGEVAAVLQGLIDSFIASSGSYLSQPSFPGQMIRRELEVRQRSPGRKFGKFPS